MIYRYLLTVYIINLDYVALKQNGLAFELVHNHIGIGDGITLTVQGCRQFIKQLHCPLKKALKTKLASWSMK